MGPWKFQSLKGTSPGGARSEPRAVQSHASVWAVKRPADILCLVELNPYGALNCTMHDLTQHTETAQKAHRKGLDRIEPHPDPKTVLANSRPFDSQYPGAIPLPSRWTPTKLGTQRQTNGHTVLDHDLIASTTRPRPETVRRPAYAMPLQIYPRIP